MVTIIDPVREKDYTDFFISHAAPVILRADGHGLAEDSVLKYLGIDERWKSVLIAITNRSKAREILKIFDNDLQLRKHGAGISFTLPFASVAGEKTAKYLSGECSSSPAKEVIEMKSEFELIVAIAKRGHVDSVMDAAREAGVKTGTAIHALSVDPKEDRSFLGISVSGEKDFIMMLVHQDIKNEAMKAIAEKAGKHTAAKSMVFSMPVNGVAGIPPSKKS